jgi:hypothetical protein
MRQKAPVGADASAAQSQPHRYWGREFGSAQFRGKRRRRQGLFSANSLKKKKKIALLFLFQTSV